MPIEEHQHQKFPFIHDHIQYPSPHHEVFKAPAHLQENDILEKRRKYICESESRKGRKIGKKSWASL